MRRFMWLLLTAVPAWAGDYVLIANPNLANANITLSEVRQVFLGIKTELAGKRVEPVLARSGDVHHQFASECLGKSESGLSNYFRMQIFSGKGAMPKTFAMVSEIVDYVSKTPGSIGYVDREADLAGVVLIELKEE